MNVVTLGEIGVFRNRLFETFAYTSTAFPMLTGTLITVAGFIPVGFARSAAGEYAAHADV